MFRAFLKVHRVPPSTIRVEALDYVINLVGEDGVGIGTDHTQGYGQDFFDHITHDKGRGRRLTNFGTVLDPEGIRTIGEMPNLTRRHGARRLEARAHRQGHRRQLAGCSARSGAPERHARGAHDHATATAHLRRRDHRHLDHRRSADDLRAAPLLRQQPCRGRSRHRPRDLRREPLQGRPPLGLLLVRAGEQDARPAGPGGLRAPPAPVAARLGPRLPVRRGGCHHRPRPHPAGALGLRAGPGHRRRAGEPGQGLLPVRRLVLRRDGLGRPGHRPDLEDPQRGNPVRRRRPRALRVHRHARSRTDPTARRPAAPHAA